MKTVGIVGGIGPESTIDYYRLIIASYRLRNPDGGYPHVVVNSIDMKKMLGLIGAGDLPDLTEYLFREVGKLARAGADFAVLASNTPHVVFDELHRRSPLPMISIVEAACEEAIRLGLKRVGLLGTRFTMQGRFYPEAFDRGGIAVLTPSSQEQTYIHDKYMGELANGIFLPETRSGLMAIAQRMRTEAAIEGLILGGTELPLILRDAPNTPEEPIPFLDTTRLHVDQIVARLLS
jgi:aspartate racemase